MKNILLGLFFVGAAAAMETKFSIDPRGVVPAVKYCFICQNDARRLGEVSAPISVMFADGQRFDYKAHPACYKKIVMPLREVIETNYPVGKVKPKHLQSFLWTLYVEAYLSNKSMSEAFSSSNLFVEQFKNYLDEQKL